MTAPAVLKWWGARGSYSVALETAAGGGSCGRGREAGAR